MTQEKDVKKDVLNFKKEDTEKGFSFRNIEPISILFYFDFQNVIKIFTEKIILDFLERSSGFKMESFTTTFNIEKEYFNFIIDVSYESMDDCYTREEIVGLFAHFIREYFDIEENKEIKKYGIPL